MRQNGLDHLRANGEHWIQGHHRVLEDHRNTVATNLAQFPLAHGRQIFAFEQNLATGNVARLGDQVQDRERRHRFTGTGLPYQPKTLAFYPG